MCFISPNMQNQAVRLPLIIGGNVKSGKWNYHTANGRALP